MYLLLVSLCVCFLSKLCQSDCLGEFQLCSQGDCVMNAGDCGKCSSGAYVCPISKSCVSSVNDYSKCPGLKGTHLDTSLTMEQRLSFLTSNLSLNEKYPQLTNNAPEIARLGIPKYNWLNDDEHGVRQSHATVFPDGCGMGATWSKEDLYTMGNIVGNEARALHNSLVHTGDRGNGNGHTITIYAPNMNLVRDPRWGRSQEVYSEDPRLTGHLTYGYVTGLQFGGVQDDKYLLTAACCKHYAAYDLESDPTSRFTFNALVDAVNWAETYSPAFRECTIRARGAHVMCSYNSINGIPACGNNYTMNTVLRNDWGWKGFVVSDYDAMAQIYNTHHYADNLEDAVSIALKAGCDQEGGGTSAINQIPNAIKDGKLSMNDVNLAVMRLFRTRIMLGFFDAPTDVQYNQLQNDSTVEGPAHLNASRLAAGHSMTLYKNNGSVLPLDASKTSGIAVIGPQGISTSLLLGNYATYPDKGVITVMQGLREAMGESTTAQCTMEQNTDYYQPGNPSQYVYSPEECCSLCFENDQCNYWTFYQNACYFKETNSGKTNSNGRVSGSCTNNPTNSKIHNQNGCANAECTSDSGFSDAINLITTMESNKELSAVLVILGLNQAIESEGHDRTTIELPGKQNELVTDVFNTVSKMDGVSLICLLIHGGTIALGDVATQCDAIIDGWYPGAQGGYGVADVLFGAMNPAGRASVTSYTATSDLPTPGQMNEYAGNGVTYRYYKGKPLYPFGFGLSYTTFTYSNLKLNVSTGSSADYNVNGCDVIGATVTVTNTGSLDGDEVVQLYVKQPSASVQVPQVRLGDFERVHIASGKSMDVNLVLTPRYHSVVYNDSSPSWYEPDIELEKGIFEVYVGGGQPDYFQGAMKTTVDVNAQVAFKTCATQY